jgi:hypothetical protein
VIPPWWHNPPEDPLQAVLLIQTRAHLLKSTTEEGHALRRLFFKLKEKFNQLLLDLRLQFPMAFWKPSYEQSLLLNAWVWGFNFPICFASNRIGKTTCFVFNALLWIFPNDPNWIVFQPYTDHLGRVVQVLPRPRLEAMVPLQKFFEENPSLAGNPNLPFNSGDRDDPTSNYHKFVLAQKECPGYYRPVYPSPPIQYSHTIWLGAPDRDWHKDTMMKIWRSLLPKSSILRDSDQDLNFRISTQSSTNPIPTTVEIQCKSYESKDEKWSGNAVQGIMLSEGFSEEILNEVKNRLTPTSFASWDYTPIEAINVGRKVQLAHKVFKGKEELPLRHHVFTKFKVADAPEHIIPRSKREDMIRNWTGKAQGKARIEGEFFSSSRQLVASLDRPFHCLTWTLEEFRNRYPTAQLYRGMDPGYDHPTAVAWGALLPNHTWVIYRFLSERNLTIPQRAEKIIEWSHNLREKIPLGTDYYYQEVHPFSDSEPIIATATDYHAFERDPTTGLSYSINYAREGLVIAESVHMSPENRVMELDRALDKTAYPFHAHPIIGRPPGSRLYFLINEPGVAEALDQIESLYWDMYQGGPHKNQSKDKVPTHGDDELDALCYLVAAPYRYIHGFQPNIRLPKDSEPEPDRAYESYLAGISQVSAEQAAFLHKLQLHQPAVGAGRF